MKNVDKIILCSFLLLALPLIVASDVNGQPEEENTSPETIGELREAILQVLQETGTPAAGIALVDSTGPVWIEGLGKADIKQNIDANEESMFRIASTSKIFVALAILQLHEQGKVSLKDRVRDLIPEIDFTNHWEDTNPILVEHLLEHTTGWDELHIVESSTSGEDRSLRDALDIHPHSRSSRWAPGTRSSYTSSGPAVAAYIVEKVTGKTYEDYIRENLFDPMGMEAMTFYRSEKYMQNGVTLYIDGNPIDYYMHALFRPSGSINASPKDMANMVSFFLNRGITDSTRLISESSLQRMETPSTTAGAKAGLKYGYGLGIYTSDHNGHTYYKHGGSLEGSRSDFSYLPEYGVGYSVQINSGNRQAINNIADLIRNYQTKDLPKPEPTDISTKSAVVFPEGGFYQQINPRNDLPIKLPTLSAEQFWKDGNTLYNQYPAFIGKIDKFIPVDDSLYQSLLINKTNLALVTDPVAGEVLEIAGSEGGTLTLGRVNGAFLLLKIIILSLWILFLLKAFLWLPFWGYQYWKGRIPTGAHVQVRLWPVLAGLFSLLTAFLIIIAEVLAGPGVISISLMLCKIPFFAAAVYSLIVVIRFRNHSLKRSVYIPAAILSVLHTLVVCYLLWHDLTGIRTWA